MCLCSSEIDCPLYYRKVNLKVLPVQCMCVCLSRDCNLILSPIVSVLFPCKNISVRETYHHHLFGYISRVLHGALNLSLATAAAPPRNASQQPVSILLSSHIQCASPTHVTVNNESLKVAPVSTFIYMLQSNHCPQLPKCVFWRLGSTYH